MFVTRKIDAQHKDLIHDVAYDFYGRRIVTCSSDQTIKVWDLKEDDEWHCTASWRDHLGSVWRAAWAHPEFGQVIASCSFDRTIAIWEEITGQGSYGEGGGPHTSWVRRAHLVDPRTSVTDLEFSPRHLGLQLATCSADGMVRIYEAQDVMNLSQWTLQYDFSTKLTASCLSWSQSRSDPTLLAVGSSNPDQNSGAKVILYEFNESGRRWDKVETLSVVTNAVNDVAFAPNIGRSYHTLAVASKEVSIFSIRPLIKSKDLQRSQGGSSVASALPPSARYQLNLMAQLDLLKEKTWRLSWNITGSILATSGDDGCVRLWQCNYLEIWRLVATIQPDATLPEPLNDPGIASAAAMAALAAGQVAYQKLGSVQGKNQVVWH